RVPAQVAHATARVGLDLLLRLAQRLADVADGLLQALDASLQLQVRGARLARHRGLHATRRLRAARAAARGGRLARLFLDRSGCHRVLPPAARPVAVPCSLSRWARERVRSNATARRRAPG